MTVDRFKDRDDPRRPPLEPWEDDDDDDDYYGPDSDFRIISIAAAFVGIGVFCGFATFAFLTWMSS